MITRKALHFIWATLGQAKSRVSKIVCEMVETARY